MTSFQKVIKYIATGFAVLLAIGIVVTILEVSLSLIGFITGWNSNNISDTKTFDPNDIKTINIDMPVASVIIKEGSEFKVDAKAVSSEYMCVLDNSILKIDDTKSDYSIFSGNIGSLNSELTITIPDDSSFETVSVDLGVGEIKIANLIVKEAIIINNGIGDIDIQNSDAKNAEFDLGIGEINFSGILAGENKFNNGIGEINLDIFANPDNYEIKKDADLGEASVKDYTNDIYKDENSPSGKISSEIGIGEIDIIFK